MGTRTPFTRETVAPLTLCSAGSDFFESAVYCFMRTTNLRSNLPKRFGLVLLQHVVIARPTVSTVAGRVRILLFRGPFRPVMLSMCLLGHEDEIFGRIVFLILVHMMSDLAGG